MQTKKLKLKEFLFLSELAIKIFELNDLGMPCSKRSLKIHLTKANLKYCAHNLALLGVQRYIAYREKEIKCFICK